MTPSKLRKLNKKLLGQLRLLERSEFSEMRFICFRNGSGVSTGNNLKEVVQAAVERDYEHLEHELRSVKARAKRLKKLKKKHPGRKK